MCERNGHNRSQSGTHNRAPSSPRRQYHDGFSVEIANIYDLVAKLLKHEKLLQPEAVRERTWILDYLAGYAKDLNFFLHSAENVYASVHLRIHYCNIVESLWIAVREDGSNRERCMSFDTRRAAFTNMEKWTGLAGFEDPVTSATNSPSMSHAQGTNGRYASHSAALKDRKKLSRTAMNAMATLCVSLPVFKSPTFLC